jgi:hypothetical protein
MTGARVTARQKQAIAKRAAQTLEEGEFPVAAMQDVLGVFSTMYRTDRSYHTRNFPKLKELVPLLPQWTPLLIQRILLSTEFTLLANKRGVPYFRTKAEQVGLTYEMTSTVAVLLDTTRVDSLRSRLRDVGVTYNTYQTWLKFAPFRNMIEAGADQMLSNSYVDMNRALVQQAVKGDVNAIKFAYELTGRYDPNSKQVMEVNAVIASMVEIIQKHVTDQDTLSSIALDLQMLAAANGLPLPVQGEVIYGSDNEAGVIQTSGNGSS